ncbi:ABC transporter substrate-binding protein [Legionella israelensis]|uniref:ABC transporter substrate-binding protein n=1 Tax=Legionella israelensis TaxID=454 RepID=A0AAX1EFJ9_9GAMM|nr:ABC transporter substrate-binding protein [Legionella israelensis]QBR83854.1 ABC transporter substrate-binding protein [Legionella israelensis]
MKPLKSMVLLLCLTFTSLVWSQTSPLPMLENAANQIINTLKKNKIGLKSNSDIIYQAVRAHLLPIVDVQGMSRSVLGRQAWRKATTAEKKEFAKEFTQLVIRTYASPLAEYTDESVKFLPIRGNLNHRFLRVNSIIIRSNGQNIPLNYSLVSKNGQWKIYDMSVEGVSLLQSFRSQFAQALQYSSIKALIQEMKQHNQKAG